MKTLHKKIAAGASALLLAAALASCGGSEVSSSGGSGVPLGYQDIVTNPPAVTYTGNAKQVSDEMTAIRQGAGPGLLVQNAKLDTAAGTHASFLVSNNLLLPGYLDVIQAGGILGGHYESAALSGFTGTSPQARANAAGYVGTVSEIMSFGAANGTDCVGSLGDSVYHLIELLSPFVEVGVAFNPGNGSGSVCAILLGVASTTLGQLPTSAAFYPFAGQAAVLPTYYNSAEVPNPAPDLTSGAGHPVAVSLYTLAAPVLNGSDIVINTFSITPAGGAALPARVLAKTGVTTSGPALTVDDAIPRAGFVVLLPVAPLAANTLHNVSFSAFVKGQPVINSWSFTTGAAN